MVITLEIDSISIADDTIAPDGNIVGLVKVFSTINIAVLPSVLQIMLIIWINDGNGYVEKPTLQLNRDTLYKFVYEEDDAGAG